MSETIVLRKNPELKIILNPDNFEIMDVSESKNNGIYSFGKLKNVNLIFEKTNWLISILSIIVDLITGSGIGGKFKNKAYLNLEMRNMNLKIVLIGTDTEKINKVSELLNNKKLLQ